ncbi:MAG: pyruvate dehydrogenase [Planctomycetota bacterium]
MTPNLSVLEQITSRAFAQMVAMIYRANHRDDQGKGDPKVGGHPAACASCIEILAGLHLVVRQPGDYVCCKPHASPADHALHHLLGLLRDPDGGWLDHAASERVMDRLRAFSRDGGPVFQSYHAESDPDSFHFLPSGSVGIPPVASAYLALAHRYAQAHGWPNAPQPHFWSLMGDSEFREGSLMEVLPDVAERELGNVTWIVDYNRQNLDGTRIPNQRGLQGTDADRIERTCEANGWRVIQVRHGSLRQEVFARPGGDALRDVLELGFTDYHLQMLLWKSDGGLMRSAAMEVDAACEEVLTDLSDDDVVRLFGDLGGHDLKVVIEALEESKKDERQPCLLVVHTLKGRGLECSAAAGNHSAIPNEAEVRALLEARDLTWDEPFSAFAPNSDEATYLAERGQEMRAGIEQTDALATQNRERVGAAIDTAGGLPSSLEINLKLAPIAHTQWMWGQIAAKLVRIGVYDELSRAGRDPGRELSTQEQRWNSVADLIMTMAPDVGTSTNINPAMDEKVFGPESEQNWEKSLELHERLRPELAPTDEAWTRHIRFEIAEANCMSAAGSFGKMGDLIGIPFLPMMTVYDFFIKRALDQLYYDLYWGSSFVLVGTPSGVTLAPEGAQHSWKSDIQIPNLITWEPSFAVELDWILCDAIERHFRGNNKGRTGVLIRAVTLGLPQKILLDNLRRQARFKQGIPAGAQLGMTSADGGLPESEVPAIPDAAIYASLREDVLAGAYYLIDYRGYRGYDPGENVVHVFVMGALVEEAAKASHALLKRGVYANVIVVSSSELLLGILGRADGYQTLRQRLAVDGSLHLRPGPQSEADVVDLAGRRIPVVSVHDGELGLLDNIGSIVGCRQITLALHKFSKSGTPTDVFGYHDLDADSIAEACGRALAESALERVQLGPAALQRLQAQQGSAATPWKELWPDPV